MPGTFENFIIRDHEENPEDDWGDEYPSVEHKATVKVLEAVGNRKKTRLNYTLLLQDELNLKQPIAFELYVESDGSVHCEAADLDDIKQDYNIEIPSQTP